MFYGCLKDEHNDVLIYRWRMSNVMIQQVNKFFVFLFKVFFEKLRKFKMERFSPEQRTKVVQFYFESQHSIHKDLIEISFMFEMHLVFQQFTDWFSVFDNKGLSVIFHVLEDLVQFEMM